MDQCAEEMADRTRVGYDAVRRCSRHGSLSLEGVQRAQLVFSLFWRWREVALEVGFQGVVEM